MNIHKAVEEYKKNLKKLKCFIIINYVIAIFGVIIWVLLYIFNYETKNTLWIPLANVLIIVLAIDMFAVHLAYIKPQKKKIINEKYKEIVKILVKDNFSGCVYSYDNTITENIITPDEVCSTGLISKGTNGFNTSHHIKSVYKGVPFRFCVFKSYCFQDYKSNMLVRNSIDGTRERVIFKGCWIVLNCHIKINSSVSIVSRNTKTEEELNYKQKISTIRRINTPNNQFNSLFSVFGYDTETPEYILTEDLMSNLILLQKHLNARLYLYFNNGMVYVGVERNKDFFAPMLSVFDSAESMIQSLYDDIKYIFTCLDMLNFSKYVTKDYTDFKIQNDSMYYTGKDVDTTYYI